MLGGEVNLWLLLGLGPLLFLGCMAVTWWGLYGDSGRGRRRCPRCWYDMSGTPGLTCTECGHAVPHEGDLQRTRRRVLPALAAAVAAALGASWVITRGNEAGWVTMLPAGVLISALPLLGEPHGRLPAELDSRLSRGELSGDQIRSLVDRCLGGDRGAPPASPEWESKYYPLLSRCRGLPAVAPIVEEALLGLPARVAITSRRTWPRDTPMCLELDVREWWPEGTLAQLRIRPLGSDDPAITVRRDTASEFSTRRARRSLRTRPFPLVLDPPPASARLEFEVSVDRLLLDGDGQWEEVQVQTIGCDVEVAGSLAEALRPAEDTSLQDAVMAAFSRGVTRWASGRSPLRVLFDPRGATYELESSGAAVGAAVEILREGTLARRLEIWWPLRPGSTGTGWLVAYEDEALLREANDTDGLWQMRVRGEASLALRAGEATSYWDGEFTVPLVVRESQEAAPAPLWWREPGSNRE